MTSEHGGSVVRVRVPTPLRSYVGGDPVVEGAGSTVDALLRDLDSRHPGLRFRMVDEQGRLRPHMRVFVDGALTRDLGAVLDGAREVTLMQALSGG